MNKLYTAGNADFFFSSVSVADDGTSCSPPNVGGSQSSSLLSPFTIYHSPLTNTNQSVSFKFTRMQPNITNTSTMRLMNNFSGFFTKTNHKPTGKYWLTGLGFLILMMSSLVGWGQLFQQDFSSSTTLSNYSATTPTNGQFNALTTSGSGTVISINTATSNKLRYARTGNAGIYVRTTDFSPTPSTLMYRFDLAVSGNNASVTNLATWQVGSGFGTANGTEANAAVHSRLGLNWTTTGGQFSIRDIGGSASSSNFSGTQTLTWVINNSGSSASYRAPDGSEEAVANDTWDLWIGSTKAFNDIAATTATQTLTDIKFAISNGVGTVDMDNFLIDPIPAIPTSAAATSVGASGFTANWSAVTGATGYRVDVATDAAFTSLVSGYDNLYVSGQSTSSLNVTGLSGSTQYWYRVRAAGQYTVGEFAGGNSTSQTLTTGSAGTPSLSVSGTFSHGSVCPNVSATPITYTITNGGTAATDVVVTSSDAQFVVSNLSSTSIGASGTATFDVTFTPTSSGAKTATISTFYNTSTTSGTASLTGTGTTPVTAVVSSSAAGTVTAQGAILNGNYSTAGVCPAVTEKGFVYSLTSSNSDPLVSGSGVTKVVVSGTITGTYNSALTGLQPSSGYSYKAYVFNGSAYTYGAVQTFTTSSALSVSGTLNHGTVCPNVSATSITYTITNNSAIAASGISVVSSDLQFVVSGLSSTTIAAGATATYVVTFTPSGAGSKTATITVSSTTSGIVNATTSLSGTGTTPVTPVITTNAASLIGTTVATLNGNLGTLGVCPASTTRGFVYSLTATNAAPTFGGTGVTSTSVAAATGNFSTNLTGLSTGTGYSFRAYVFDGTTFTYGSVLTFTTLAPPVNDDCTGAIALTLNAAATSGTVANASQSIAAITCAAATGTADDDVWYSFTTSISANYTITVAGGSSFDAVIDLRSGACNGTNIGCADAGASGTSETLTVALAASTTYYVRVYHYGSTAPSTPTFTIAVTVPVPQLSVSTSSLTFAAQTQLTNSASQTFNLSGTNLSGFPGTITVTTPSSDFQVSIDNNSWGATATIAFTSATLASTSFYVRFSPQSTGAKSGDITFSGGGIASSPVVTLSGTGTLELPVVNPATLLTNNSFTANWGAVSGAASYQLDVSTISPAFTTVVGWNFPSNPDNAIADAGISANAAKVISLVGASGAVSYAPLSSPNSTTSVATVSGWNGGSGSDYWQVEFATTGHVNIRVSSVQRSSNTGPKDFKLQYRIGTGGAWTDVTGGAINVANDYTTGILSNVSLPSVTNNQASVFLRWIMTSNVGVNGSAVASGGTSAIDNVLIEGNAGGFVSGYENLTVVGTSQAVTGLVPNTTYYINVRSVDAVSTSANSNPTLSVTTYTNAIATADFQSRASGDFSSIATWEYNTGNAGFVPATAAPTSTNKVDIFHTVTLDQNFTVGSGKRLTLRTEPASPGSLIIGPTANLAMTDATSAINFNGRPVTVQSTATGTGSIGKMAGALSNATNVTVERYIPANARRAYRLLTAPTSGQTIKQSWQEGLSNGAVGTNNLGTLITGNYSNTAAAQARGFDAYTPGTSMFSYNPVTNAYVAIDNTNTKLIDSVQGWLVYIRGDRRDAATNTTVNPTTLRTTGSINTGTPVVTNVTANQNAVIGNPYASAIDLTKVSMTGGLAGTVAVVWDPKIGTQGGYVNLTPNGDPVTGYTASPAANGYAAYNNTIQSGQAFFAQAGTTNGTVTINEDSKVAGSTQEVFRPAGPAVPTGISQRLFADLYSTAGSKIILDGIFISLDDAHSNDIDNFDGRKRNNFTENLGMRSQGVNLAVEKRKPFVSNDTVFFNTTSLRRTTYQLSFNTENLDPNMVATLEDTYLNTKTLVNPNGNSTYDFTVDANVASAAADRFRVVFRALESGPLPVTFTSIKAAQQNNDIAVEWKVGSQLNIAGYEVERAVDGRNFVKVASVEAGASATYNWLDVNAIQGTNFYRVRAIDNNGTYKYTQIVKITLGRKGSAITVSPNPAQGNTVSLQFTNQLAGKYRINLTNAAGQLMCSNILQHSGGSSSQTFTLSSQIISGVYQLEIIAPDKTRRAQKLIVK